jgi:hypothetical protein
MAFQNFIASTGKLISGFPCNIHSWFFLVVFCLFAEEFGQLQFNKSSFDVSAIVHPQGIKNVVLFGSRQGSLQLWNINTSKLLYTFVGWDSAVTALEQVC